MPDSLNSPPSVPAPDSLPVWDLSDLYPGPDSPELAADLQTAEIEARAFSDRYAGRLSSLSGAGMAQAVAEYERCDSRLGRIMSFAGLLYAGDRSDPGVGRFYQTMQEKVTAISVHLLFFTLEINRLSDSLFEKLLSSPSLRHYAPWLRDTRIYRPHQLSDEVEKLLHEKQVAGRNAWGRLFDETMSSLRFPVGDRSLTSAEALNLLSDRDPSQRQAAALSLGRVLTENQRLFAQISNTLAKDKEIEDRWRRYAQPWSARNLSNRVEDSVVEALVTSVRAAFPRLSHRYYQLKARWFGVPQLAHWDRNAPLPDSDDRQYCWDEARTLVLHSYARFSPDLAALGQRFFDNAWIDAQARPGKNPGAFAHSTVPEVHPYLLLNYLGRSRDVMTLAHELGHGVHQLLAAGQGYLLADTPLTLAETASVFGEMLTFRSLLDAETDPARRRILLAGKVEDMLNTVVRQIAFYEFERRLHTTRREAELTADQICDIWMAVQRESLGPAFQFDDSYRMFWAYIPHFIHSPFYVYAYAFGDCLVNSLYAAYQDAERAGEGPAFAARYQTLLSAGGSRPHRELLAPFGLDATDPAFWDRGLAMLAGFIDELEHLG
jgi:oligoendopeptidase F